MSVGLVSCLQKDFSSRLFFGYNMMKITCPKMWKRTQNLKRNDLSLFTLLRIVSQKKKRKPENPKIVT